MNEVLNPVVCKFESGFLVLKNSLGNVVNFSFCVNLEIEWKVDGETDELLF